jgi:hypothetical protein
MLPILYGKVNARMNPPCPICQATLFERHAGLYCYNAKCPAFSQKVVACCEGGDCAVS